MTRRARTRGPARAVAVRGAAQVRRYAIPVIFGFVGMVTILFVVHLWHDHAALHVLIAIEQQRQAAARPSAVPPPPSGAVGGR